MKVNVPIDTSRHQSTKKEKTCKAHLKKTVHIDAYICINIKKKNPYSLRHKSNIVPTAGHCILKAASLN